MLIIKEKVKADNLIRISEYYNPEEVIFFDIETTGLSPDYSMLYIIGFNYYENGAWYITQLFNDDGVSEAEMTEYFMDFITKYRYIIHFNGDRFDIPYVTKRIERLCGEYPLTNNFKELISIDLYRTLKPFKKILQMSSMKQKAFEEYLGINRDDMYTGGELIQVYYSYLRKKSEDEKKLLLLHNRDDMEGMLFLSSMLAVPALLTGDFSLSDMFVKASELCFKVSLDHALPQQISLHTGKIKAEFKADTGLISIQIFMGELKLYFDNYTDYYYIPSEDTAVYRDIGISIDSSMRVRAKRDTCYIRRSGYFIPVPDCGAAEIKEALTDSDIKIFKSDLKSKDGYIELSDSFLGNTDKIMTYLRHLVCNKK